MIDNIDRRRKAFGVTRRQRFIVIDELRHRSDLLADGESVSYSYEGATRLSDQNKKWFESEDARIEIEHILGKLGCLVTLEVRHEEDADSEELREPPFFVITKNNPAK